MYNMRIYRGSQDSKYEDWCNAKDGCTDLQQLARYYIGT